MALLKWIIIILSLLNFGYMAIDGARGLIIGDYIRPKTGQHAGQLGPWAKVVEKVGVNPESTLMKWLFLLWGAVGIAMAIAFGMGVANAHKGLLYMSIGSLWYLVPGTVLSTIVIILLLVRMKMKP
ncbi:MAG: hypothetical protein R2800_04470 [Flavipsychrobacter sp.]